MAGSSARPGREAGRRYFDRVLGLFFVAAFIPVIALSFAMTGIAGAALESANAERGRAAATSFAAAVDELCQAVRGSVDLIAQTAEAQAAFAGPGSPPPDEPAVAAIGRLLAREAGRREGLAFALVPAEAGRPSFSTRGLPPDWDAAVYGDWGLLRAASEAPGTVFEARRRITDSGEAALAEAGRAVRDGQGRLRGFVLVEMDRSSFVKAARAAGMGPGVDYELRTPRGLVAFSLGDSGREGRYLDDLPGGAAAPAGMESSSARSESGFEAVAMRSSGLPSDFRSAMRGATVLGLAACALIALVLALLASRIVTRPVLALSGAMRKLGDGDLGVRLEPHSDDELGDLVRSFNATAEELGRLMKVAVEDQELLRGAELRSLAAQMNPHFLYNSLNSIRSLAKLGRDAEIVEVVARLGKLLRASAENRGEASTVGAGLELVRHYLAVERIRFGDRLSFEEDIEEAVLGVALPSLVLEPLAENALTHGLERKRGKGRLRIEGRVEAGVAVLAFEDDGPGAPPVVMAEISRHLAEGSLPGGGDAGRGLGLAATNRRLRLRYGEGYGLTVSGREGEGFRVELRVPAARDGAP